MNKQSNTYTLIYILVLVAVVGAALAFTATSLAPKQEANADADKMSQILLAVHKSSEPDNVISDFKKYIVRQEVVNSAGKVTGNDAFAINVAAESKIADPAKRRLPVYVCDLGAEGLKYIIPVYGSGLWGPIWGYVAVNGDGKTVYGAYFAHQGETPGLGAEIEKPAFSGQFDGKQLWDDGKFTPVQVVKNGQIPAGQQAHYVDGVSGGTITSKGVSAMLQACLTPYAAYLESLSKK